MLASSKFEWTFYEQGNILYLPFIVTFINRQIIQVQWLSNVNASCDRCENRRIMMYGFNSTFFLYAKIHELTWTPSQGDRRNADVPDDLKCRRGGFTLQLPRQAVSVIVQVVNNDERRNLHCRSREFCMFVPRNLIILLQALGCTNFILHQWYICGLFVLGTCDLCIGNSLMKGGHIAHLRQECHNSKFGIFELLV